MEQPERITVEQLHEAIRALGLDPAEVETVTLTHEAVTVTTRTTYSIDDPGSGVWPTRRAQDVIPIGPR